MTPPDAQPAVAVEQGDIDLADEVWAAFTAGDIVPRVLRQMLARHRLAAEQPLRERVAELERELDEVQASMTYRHSLIGRTQARVKALKEAVGDMLVAFAEGVVWSQEQRDAYERLAALAAGPAVGEGAL